MYHGPQEERNGSSVERLSVYIVQSIFQESTLKLRKKKSYDGLSFCLSVAQLTTCDVQC